MTSEDTAHHYTYKYSTEYSTHEWLDKVIVESIAGIKIRSILDLGCGNGHMAKRLAQAGYQVTGCDPEESAIQIAKSNSVGVVFEQIGVYDEPSKRNLYNFDLVLASEVIEHLFLPRALTAFASKVLNDNGYLVITTPYYGSYIKNMLSSIFDKWDDHFTALWDGGHIKFWSYNTLEILLNEGGFKVIDYRLVNRSSKFLNFIWPNNIVVIARKITAG